MKRTVKLVCGAVLVAASIAPAVAQETRQQAVAGMRKVDPKEMDPTYTKAAPLAQKLVDEALAKHPEVILIAIHAQPPNHKNLIVASNFGRIGKIGDEDDLRCIRTGKSNLEGARRKSCLGGSASRICCTTATTENEHVLRFVLNFLHQDSMCWLS